jgi:hypothetical protein
VSTERFERELPARSSELDRASIPEEVLAVIAAAVAELEAADAGHAAPAEAVAPGGPRYVWRFSGRWWSRPVPVRRDRPVRWW